MKQRFEVSSLYCHEGEISLHQKLWSKHFSLLHSFWDMHS